MYSEKKNQRVIEEIFHMRPLFMSKNTYGSNLWRKIREYVLLRDNEECQFCHIKPVTSKLHIHHYAYVREVPVDDVHPDLLVCLCNDCHSGWHRKNQSERFDNEEEALAYVRERFHVKEGKDIRLEFPICHKKPIELDERMYCNLERLSKKFDLDLSYLATCLLRVFFEFKNDENNIMNDGHQLINNNIDIQIQTNREFGFFIHAIKKAISYYEPRILNYICRCKQYK